jgi:hypothetical protein
VSFGGVDVTTTVPAAWGRQPPNPVAATSLKVNDDFAVVLATVVASIATVVVTAVNITAST